MKSACPKPEQASSKLLVLTGDSCFLILSAFDIRISSFPNGVGWFVVMTDLSSKRDGERSPDPSGLYWPAPSPASTCATAMHPPLTPVRLISPKSPRR